MDVLPNTRSLRRQKLVYGCIILLIALFSISSQSLWGDEICRVEDAVIKDYPATLAFSLKCGQPGYMSIMYVWIQLLFGHTGEFFLRLSNVLFALPAIFYAFRIIEKKGWPLWTSLVFFLHPMFIYYMDETTPYILIYGLSMALIYHTFYVDDFSSRKNIIRLNVIFLVGVFVHFIFGFAMLLYFVRCLQKIRMDKKLIRRHAGIMAIFCIGYLPLLYALLTRLDGTSTGFSIRNLMYVAYSFLGMAGMSLSRTDMRAGNFYNLQPVHIVIMAVFALAVIALLIMAVVRKSGFLRRNKDLLAGVLVYMGILVAAAIVVRFGVWERHCMALFPIYIILICDLIVDVRRARAGKALLALYFALLMFSGINLRVNYYHVSDDRKGLMQEVDALLDADADGEITLMMECRYHYYDAYALLNGPDQKIIDTLDMRQRDIFTTFSEKVEQGEDAVLILFEKAVMREFYTYYDENPDYVVNDSYNSFKIIRPVAYAN